VDTQGESVRVDLSDITFLEPFAVVYLGLFMTKLEAEGREVVVDLPVNTSVRKYLSNQNFYERFEFDADSVATERKLRRPNTTSLNNIVEIEKRPRLAEDVSEQVMSLLRRQRIRVDTGAVAENVAELVDNFSQHSGETKAVFMVQYYPTQRRLDFAIGDCGIGIRASLGSVGRYAYLAQQPHLEAALAAFRPGVTSKREGGTGLTDLHEWIIESRGHLVLATGDAYVQVVRGETRHGAMAYEMAGVQIEFSLWEG
jgi:hypothetical protein